MNLLERMPEESNRNYIYRTLRANIMHLSLIPGAHISETELSAIFNLSRTPIREALILLEKEKLIEILPKKKSRVSLIHLDLVHSAVFLRKAVEKEIIHEACERIDSDTLLWLKNNLEFQKNMILNGENHSSFYQLDNLFHAKIYNSVQKESVWSTLENMSTHYNRLRHLDASENISLSTIVVQHDRLIQIIENKDHESVETFVDTHLKNVFHRLDEVRAKFGSYMTD